MIRRGGSGRPLPTVHYPLTWRVLSPRGRIAMVMVLVSLGLGLTAFVAPVAGPRATPREINLVARDMAFYLSDATQAGPNPTLRLKAGEQVRITLRNQDPGIKHTFAVKAWKLVVTPFRGHGGGSVLVRAPQRLGRYDYVCIPHPTLMAGVIEVVASD